MLIFATALASCKDNKTSGTDNNDNTTTESVSVIGGTYVSDGYEKRNEGIDWVGITVKQLGEKDIWLSVRSRADKKKPTCTMDMKAYLQSGNVYTGVAEGKNVEIILEKDALSISTANKDDESALHFYCSGGATITGTYKKISDDLELDPSQVDKTEFIKVLHLQDLNFTVSTMKEGYDRELSIYVYGSEVKNNTTHTEPINGYIYDAEVNDLNADGIPELLIYTVAEGTGRFGNVVGYSVDKAGKMTAIEFPDVNENSKLSPGYGGHDEFSLVENTLMQRFPIYKEGDANAMPTGGTRQVAYKMVKSKKGYAFEVAEIKDLGQ